MALVIISRLRPGEFSKAMALGAGSRLKLGDAGCGLHGGAHI